MAVYRLIPIADHPSNLDPTAVLVSPTTEHRYTVYKCAPGFVVTIPFEHALQGYFTTKEQATLAAEDYVLFKQRAEEAVERLVERKMDWLDRKFMNSAMTQAEYNQAVAEVNAEADKLLCTLVTRGCPVRQAPQDTTVSLPKKLG